MPLDYAALATPRAEAEKLGYRVSAMVKKPVPSRMKEFEQEVLKHKPDDDPLFKYTYSELITTRRRLPSSFEGESGHVKFACRDVKLLEWFNDTARRMQVHLRGRIGYITPRRSGTGTHYYADIHT